MLLSGLKQSFEDFLWFCSFQKSKRNYKYGKRDLAVCCSFGELSDTWTVDDVSCSIVNDILKFGILVNSHLVSIDDV